MKCDYDPTRSPRQEIILIIFPRQYTQDQHKIKTIECRINRSLEPNQTLSCFLLCHCIFWPQLLWKSVPKYDSGRYRITAASLWPIKIHRRGAVLLSAKKAADAWYAGWRESKGYQRRSKKLDKGRVGICTIYGKLYKSEFIVHDTFQSFVKKRCCWKSARKTTNNLSSCPWSELLPCPLPRLLLHQGISRFPIVILTQKSSFHVQDHGIHLPVGVSIALTLPLAACTPRPRSSSTLHHTDRSQDSRQETLPWLHL